MQRVKTRPAWLPAKGVTGSSVCVPPEVSYTGAMRPWGNLDWVEDSKMKEVAIRLHIEPLEEGGFVATSADVPGLVAEGRSIVETVEIAQGLTRKIVESCLEHEDPVPTALTKLLSGGSIELQIPVSVR